MTRIDCRNPECGFTRSATVCSDEGEHIPECYGCGDPAYTDPWDDLYGNHDLMLEAEDDTDGTKFWSCACGEGFMVFPGEVAKCPKDT